MNTNNLKRFAREARIKLIDQVGRKLEFVLSNTDPVFLDTNATQIQSLKNKLQSLGKEQVIDTVAYTWFNRLMALRFMDANGYTSPKVVTPVVGKSPEILQNALSGQIDESLKINRQRLNDLLDGKLVIADAQTEAYKMLLIGSCNQWHSAMPFMFERISDYTELLLPDDLLSENSIITDIRNGMSDEDCGQEELIGWLYQFYIADKKDDVFEGLKKNIKITAENIPAATQLFTPRWIVRYMVENTLGKLWLTLKPNSKLRQFMPYYIEAPEGNAPAPLPEGIKGVTDITFLDPCQGSGHVLVYTFDLFTKIYEEEGYNTNEIPALILEHNLFGIDIDERAAQLAAFALTMKARSYFSRFLRKPVQPHVIALENVNEDIIKQAVKLPLAVAGKLVYDYRDLTLYNLTQADNFGSLIQIDPEELKALSIQKGSIWQAQEQKLKEQAEYLSRQYYCVVTNPPYMGQKGMNDTIREFVEKYYQEGKADLMTSFMLRCTSLSISNGHFGMINLPSWLFLTSFSLLRKHYIDNLYVNNLLHFGRGIFGIDFGSVAFTIQNSKANSRTGNYFKLFERNFQHIYFNDIEKLFLYAKNNKYYRYDFQKYRDESAESVISATSDDEGFLLSYPNVNQNNFLSIPTYQFGYWLNEDVISLFKNKNELANYSKVKVGLQTGDNNKFRRSWFEVNRNRIRIGTGNEKWVPYNSGGDYRKWYGNQTYVVNWENDGDEIKHFKDEKGKLRSRPQNVDFYFKPSVSWSKISAGALSLRYYPAGFIFDVAGCSIFSEQKKLKYIIGALNSSINDPLLISLSPTMNYEVGQVSSYPIKFDDSKQEAVLVLVDELIDVFKKEWDTNELSWNFTNHINLETELKSFNEIQNKLTGHFKQLFIYVKDREEKLNTIFAELYKLPSVLLKVPFENIPLFKEFISARENELVIDWALLISNFISYSVGVMLGRFSLNKPGFILANNDETIQDFLKQIPSPTFMPDEDNIIPVLEGEWFPDDIVERFKLFLKAAFGQEHFEENLQYIEDTNGKDIRKYFVKDFYNDHIKRYKKRPIYWMFSSPKGHFKALIYMHRYTPDLCSKMLTDYLQSYINKLEAAQQNKIAESLREDLPARERTAATKEADRYSVMIKDCKEYAQILYAVATRKITIDLDDGVKVNYQKFKEVLVPIKGLEKDEE
jgi:hypothetical protein